MDDSKNANSINIYPNPSDSFFTIEFAKTENYRIEIIDMKGSSIASWKVQNSRATSWNATKQKSGIYYAVITAGTKRYTHKIIRR